MAISNLEPRSSQVQSRLKQIPTEAGGANGELGTFTLLEADPVHEGFSEARLTMEKPGSRMMSSQAMLLRDTGVWHTGYTHKDAPRPKGAEVPKQLVAQKWPKHKGLHLSVCMS